MSTADSSTFLVQSPRRPATVTALAVLVVIVGIVTLIGSIIGILGSQYVISTQPETGPMLWPAIGGVFVGLAYLAVARGLLRGRGFVWRLAVLVAGLSLFSAVLGLVLNQGYQRWATLVPVVLSAGVLYLLYSADAKAFFRSRSPRRPGPVSDTGSLDSSR